jgi:hypothetical protein
MRIICIKYQYGSCSSSNIQLKPQHLQPPFGISGKMSLTGIHGITEMKGLFALFFAYAIGRTMKKNLPLEMEAMVKKAESLKGIS